LIAVDTNILVYAHRQDSPFHDQAKLCVEQLSEAGRDWALPWPCIHEFLAVVTNGRAFRKPSTLNEATGQIDAWLEAPSLVLLSESARYWTTLHALLIGTRTSGPQVHDARIAAICIDYGVEELWSADRDFSRFAGIKVVNPLRV
jgi:uncharacterized protein